MVGGTAEVTTAVEVITGAATVMAEAMGAAVMVEGRAAAITEVADPVDTTGADMAMEVTGVEGLVTATVVVGAEAMAVGIMAETDPAMIVMAAMATVAMAAESLATTVAEANPAGMTAAVASPAAIAVETAAASRAAMTVAEDLAETAEVATAAAMVAGTIAATNAKPIRENRTRKWSPPLGSIRCSLVERAHCADEPKVRASEKPDPLSRCAGPSLEDLKRDAHCVPFSAMGTSPRKLLGRLMIPDRRQAFPSLVRSGAPQRLRLRLWCRGRLGERSPAA